MRVMAALLKFIKQQWLDILSIIGIISISIGSCIKEQHINSDNSINILGTLSAIGTLTIGYFSWRAYTTVFQTTASEIQFNRVINLIEDLKKVKISTETKNKESKVVNPIELWNNHHNLYLTKKPIIGSNNAKTGNINDFKKNKLEQYCYDPLVPKQIRKALEELNKKFSNNREEVQASLKIIKAIDQWFRDNNMKDYTLDNNNL